MHRAGASQTTLRRTARNNTVLPSKRISVPENKDDKTVSDVQMYCIK